MRARGGESECWGEIELKGERWTEAMNSPTKQIHREGLERGVGGGIEDLKGFGEILIWERKRGD